MTARTIWRIRKRGGPDLRLRLTIAVCASCATAVAVAQSRFIDDAQRSVPLPARVSRVFAAGAPAEVLLYTLAPGKLAGRNHLPDPAALEFMPPELRTPVPIQRLPEARDARNDVELLALRPDLYLDYGDVNEDYVRAVGNVQQRTGIPGILLDGALERIPATYRRLGEAIGEPRRGRQLAAHAQRILDRYRGVARVGQRSVRVYLACSADGTIPCLEGETGGEIVRHLGAVNVAGDARQPLDRPVTPEEIRAWNPDVIIAGSGAALRHIRGDADWQGIPAVAAGRVYLPPAQPFAWGPRPPSVNRLPGLIWHARVLTGRPLDRAFVAEIRAFFGDFYHLRPSAAQVSRLVMP